MKNFKRAFLMALAAALLFGGCSGNKNPEAGTETETEDAEESATPKDFVEEYVSNLSTDEERESFLSFWNDTQLYCKRIKIELKSIENTEKFEFDPTDDENIPEAARDIFNYAEIKMNASYDKHSDYLLTIDGEDVSLEYDGHVFYPSDYSYTEMQDVIQKFSSDRSAEQSTEQ